MTKVDMLNKLVKQSKQEDDASNRKLFVDYTFQTDKRVPGTVFFDEAIALHQLNVEVGDLCQVNIIDGRVAFVKVN